jgi:hypothetical protein
MAAKRHLPVLKNQDVSEVPVRSNAYVVFLGALSIFVSWLPLGVLGLWATQALAEAGATHAGGGMGPGQGLLSVLPLLTSFALACGAGGAIVAWLAASTPLRLALLAGPVATSGLVLLVYVQGALRPHGLAISVWLVLLPISSLFAAIGARLGRKSPA